MAILVFILCLIGVAASLTWLATCLIRRRPKKRAGILLVACLVIGFAAALAAPKVEKKDQPAPEPSQTVQEASSSADEKETAEPVAEAPAEKTPQEQLEEICRASLSSGDELVRVEVNEDMSKENAGQGKLIVLPYFKSQSGFRSAELMKAGKMIQAIYASGLPVSDVTTFTQDMSGHTIMKCTMDAKRAAALDWSSVNYNTFDKDLSKFWAVQSLRK